MNVEEGQTFGMELEFTEGMQFGRRPHLPVHGHRPGSDGGSPRGPQIRSRTRRSVRSATSCRSSSRRCRVVSRSSSSPRRRGRVPATLVVNKLRGTFTGVAGQGPLASAIAASACSRTIAIPAGGEVITEEMGLKLENTQLSQLGRAASRRRVQGHRRSSTVLVTRRRSRVASARSAPRSRTPTPTSIGRSSRSVSRSSRAVSRSSRSALPPRPR